jgi:hypothetical protein
MVAPSRSSEPESVTVTALRVGGGPPAEADAATRAASPAVTETSGEGVRDTAAADRDGRDGVTARGATAGRELGDPVGSSVTGANTARFGAIACTVVIASVRK